MSDAVAKDYKADLDRLTAVYGGNEKELAQFPNFEFEQVESNESN